MSETAVLALGLPGPPAPAAELSPGKQEALQDKPGQHRGTGGMLQQRGRDLPWPKAGDLGAWVTLGTLRSGHCAQQSICPLLLGDERQAVREQAGQLTVCLGESRCCREGLCHPTKLSPPASLPWDSPAWGEGIMQGKQCHHNTVPLNYSPALGGNIVPGLLLLSY